MAKSNSTAAETQLKARRTSLGKKSKEDLINIILRKDKTERSNNSKIQSLTALLKEADTLNEDKSNVIEKLKVTANDNYDKLQQSFTDNKVLRERIANMESDMEGTLKTLNKIKGFNKILRKTFWFMLMLLIVLVVIFIVLGF